MIYFPFSRLDMNLNLYFIMFQRRLINSSCTLCSPEFTIFRHFLVKFWRLYIHLFCTHGVLLGTHHKIETLVYIQNSRNYTILIDVYNMSQFRILGKLSICMALILFLTPDFCEEWNVSEPFLNSFCPLNPLLRTSAHMEFNVASNLSLTVFWCFSMYFFHSTAFQVIFSRGEINYLENLLDVSKEIISCLWKIYRLNLIS